MLVAYHAQTEGKPPEDAFNPVVKRSGWQPPQDTGLWGAADAVQAKVWHALEQPTREHLQVCICLSSTFDWRTRAMPAAA